MENSNQILNDSDLANPTFTCLKCHTEKSTKDFFKKSNIKRGHDGSCKVCREDMT